MTASFLSPSALVKVERWSDLYILGLKLCQRRTGLATGLRTSRALTVGQMIPKNSNTIFQPNPSGVESVPGPLGHAIAMMGSNIALQPVKPIRLSASVPVQDLWKLSLAGKRPHDPVGKEHQADRHDHARPQNV